MKSEIEVRTGEVKACNREGILRSSAIGSCVVVTAFDPNSCVGSIAHVMLPGSSCYGDSTGGTKYAVNAVEEMMRIMADLGAEEARTHTCLIGGGNVLGHGHDTPGPEIIRSLTETLGRKGITPVATDVGGTQRRSCALDVTRGRVTYTVGDSGQRVLWEAGAGAHGPYDIGRRNSRSSGKDV